MAYPDRPEGGSVLHWREGAVAGGDVAAMAAAPVAAARELIREMHGAVTVLNPMRVPVIAQVHGAAAGAAIGVLMGSDLVAAAEGSKFSLAFPAIGASADSSSTWSSRPRPSSPAPARTTSPRAPPPSWRSGRRVSKAAE